MRKRFAVAAVLLLAALLLAAAAFAEVKDNAAYQGNKARITVGTIKTKASKCSGAMAASIGEMLSTALSQNEKFIVLATGEEVAELQDEIALGKSGAVEQGRGPESGLMEGADLLITGAVTAFEPAAGGGGGLLGAAKNKLAGQVGVSGKTAEIGLDLRLIDIRTRRVLKAMPLEAKSTSWKTGIAGAGWAENMALAGALGSFSNQPMEKAIRGVLVKAVEQIADEVPADYYRYQGGGQYKQEYGKSGGEAAASSAESGGGAASGAAGGAAAGASAAAAGPTAEDLTLYTKYDFVPGDKVILYDDLAKEEAGDFPSRWGLVQGVFEVARLGKTNWILCTDGGAIYPKIPAGPLPPKFTIEMDIYDNGPDFPGSHFHIGLMQAKRPAIEFLLYDKSVTMLRNPRGPLASKNLPQRLTKGVHTMRIMATPTTLKCYVDNERVGNVPRLEDFVPDGIQVYCEPDVGKNNTTLLGNFRYAEGGKSMREQLDAGGKIVTHGILFDSGSAVIKAESYKTLSQISDLLREDASLKLSIEGHTDSDGADDANMALSQQRAEAVKAYLVSGLQVGAERLQAKGLGESKPIDTNNTPEGKANNRRVELVKL